MSGASHTSLAGPTSSARTGTFYGLTAYALWGAMPIYFTLLAPAGALEIVVHRVLWSALLCLVLVASRGELQRLAAIAANRRELLGVTAAGLLVATNWTLFLIAVSTARITEAALGYFLNPLLSVALGLVVLRERLRPLQWLAVAIGGTGGLYLAWATGGIPWIALGLAFSFSGYGLAKNLLGVRLSALQGLAAETLVVAPLALAALSWLLWQGPVTFTGQGPWHAAMLAFTGVTTTVPLLLFAAAARRVTLVMIGLMQFVAPVLQFLTGLWLGESMTQARWNGFAIVWVALIVLAIDLVYGSMRNRRAAHV